MVEKGYALPSTRVMVQVGIVQQAGNHAFIFLIDTTNKNRKCLKPSCWQNRKHSGDTKVSIKERLASSNVVGLMVA